MMALTLLQMEIFIIVEGPERKCYMSVKEDTTVLTLKSMIYEEIGIAPELQHLTYEQEDLLDDMTIGYYHIKPGATIRCFKRSSAYELEHNPSRATESKPSNATSSKLSNNPRIKPPVLGRQETAMRIAYWQARAIAGNFNADIHIVDPIAHQAHLDYLESDVVTSSEYFRCGGKYDLESNSAEEISSEAKQHLDYTDAMLERLPTLFGRSFSKLSYELPAAATATQLDLTSLWKSYIIVSRVLASFSQLSSVGFCDEFYSMLVQHPGRDVAELVQIPQKRIQGLKKAIEISIVRCFDENANPKQVEEFLIYGVAPACADLLNLMYPHTSIPTSNTRSAILTICRATVLLLDLALVAYVGSHGSRFDSYIESGSACIEIGASRKDLNSFACMLRPLACLSEFLSDASVWVFQVRNGKQSITGHGKSPKLSVLTRIDTFADVWGPVWQVSPSNKASDRVWQYNVSRGFIRPVHVQQTASTGNVVVCHWFGPSNGRQLPDLGDTPIEFSTDDTLVIGAPLRVNDQCCYALDQYESDMGFSMGFLGTLQHRWGLDTRAFGITAGLYVTVTATGTQKRLPGVTLKEHIWNSFKQSPLNANIGWLNNFAGVEISHCTGNARRVRMKDLLQLPSVRNRLNSYSPDWDRTGWGRLFSNALRGESFEAISTMWAQNRDMRNNVADLICALLELLHYTGEQGDGFTAAYFSRANTERQLTLELKYNEWARCLRDSDRTATYAVIGNVCLGLPVGGISMGICNHKPTKTIFQTSIIFRDVIPSETDLVRLEPLKVLFRVRRMGRRSVTLLPVDGRAAIELLHPNFVTAIEIMEDFNTNPLEAHHAIILAGRESNSGMDMIRQVVRPQQQRPQQQRPQEQRPQQQHPWPGQTEHQHYRAYPRRQNRPEQRGHYPSQKNRRQNTRKKPHSHSSCTIL